MSSNKKKMILLFVLMLMCVFLTSGYVYAVNKTLMEAKIKVGNPIWNIKFTDVETTKKIGKASNFSEPILTDNVISLFASFENPGDSISYKIKISNVGNLKAKLNNIGVYSNLIDVIDFEYSDIYVGNVLNPSDSMYFNIKFTYNPKDKTIQKEDKIMLVLDWIQSD